MNLQTTNCCRICLKSELLMSIYLYTPTFPMRPIEIIEKLNIFKYDENLPTLLCQSCLYRLLDAYNLQQLAEASEQRLREYIGNGCGGISSSGVGLCDLSNISIDQDSSSFSSTAAICDTGRGGERVKEAGVTATIYENICDIFERNNLETSNLTFVEKGCMGVTTADDMLNDIEIDVSSLTRSEANEDTLNEVRANKHTNFDFNRIDNMEEAVAMTATDKDSNLPTSKEELGEKCSECGKVFKNCICLETHIRTHTNEKLFQCKQCSRQFKQSGSLLIHQRTHTGERRFQCEICANLFTTSSNLKAHKAIHLECREYRCPQCERDFKTLRQLRRHEAVHKTVKEHICEICQKAFNKRSYLRDHITAMHRGGGRRHKCAECGKLFGRRSNLVSHIRIHSGDKPFQCKLCTWKFNQCSALARHMKKHSKSKNILFDLKTTDEVLKSTALKNAVAAFLVNDAGVNNLESRTSCNVLSNMSNLHDDRIRSLETAKGSYARFEDATANMKTAKQQESLQTNEGRSNGDGDSVGYNFNTKMIY
ncbi:zinc finger protein 430-like [Eurosta solidaginis]|uniref:zinc finger protein 430-like n=1 Tax=Eurosta solidaginis TaxID=178769 RepID=UPI003530C7AB